MEMVWFHGLFLGDVHAEMNEVWPLAAARSFRVSRNLDQLNQTRFHSRHFLRFRRRNTRMARRLMDARHHFIFHCYPYNDPE